MVDLETLRAKLRRMDRAGLLIIAERAIELVSQSELQALLGDRIDLAEVMSAADPGIPSLLDEARRFHTATLRGDYWEDFFVTSASFMSKSPKTEAFLAEFDRIVNRCTREAERGQHAIAREAFEIIFDMVRRIGACNEDLVFFVDGGGIWEYETDWREMLSVYIRCLAETAPPEKFARETRRVIQDLVPEYETRLLAEAERYASAAHKAALSNLG